MDPSVRESDLRKEIERLKAKIEEGQDWLETLKEDHNALNVDRDNFRDPESMSALSQTLKSINRQNDEITKSKELLSAANADLRNTAILEGYLHHGLVAEGPDSAYVPDVSKFQLMTRWLEVEKVLLLRSPPSSGKTSFAIRFANYLNNYAAVAYYMDASRTRQRLNEGATMDDILKQEFHLSLDEICLRSRDRYIYLIMDEVQTWYLDGLQQRVGQELENFWNILKILKQERDWTVYTTERANGASESEALAKSIIQVRVLLLAGYWERSLGSITTPFEFVDPVDPVTNQRLPLGLDFLRMGREKTFELITKYVALQNAAGGRISFGHDQRIHELIFRETNGHVGAIRIFLSHAVGIDMKTPEAITGLVSQNLYQTDLRGGRVFLSVGTKFSKFDPQVLALLIRCIVLYKQGHRNFQAIAVDAVALVKRGILVKTLETNLIGNTTLAFPSPIHFDLTLYRVLHCKVTLGQSRASFEGALKEMVLRMDPKLLHDTTPDGQWQDECVRSFRSMTDKTVKTKVGREYNQRAYLDMHVTDGLLWGIELIWRGSGKRLEEHVRRFSETDGRYRRIPMKQYAVLNFTDEVPNLATLDMYSDNVWHLVYNPTYTKVTVYRKGHISNGDQWDLIGFQGRTEY